MSMRHGARAAAVAGFVGLTISLAGCGAKVSQEQYNADIAKLREEMQAGDRPAAAKADSASRMAAAQQTRLDSLDQQYQALRNDYQASVEKVKGQLRFNVPVHFDFDQSELREADRPVLDQFASVVKEHYPGALVTAEGFADPSGDYQHNLALGQARADAVRDYLVGTAGLAEDEVRAVSYGEILKRQVVPGAEGPGDTGIENRRVTLVIDHAAVVTDRVAMP
jgi:peptidoglycan-associated lipoprotein